ncbi:MFS transporter [Streptomyces sp. NPDC059256]|uniref:MFS transporter n=1 Tax=Streptomyces sp. NPDC059256 TaxID=3346794 RepID=UPI003684BB5A
MKGRIRFLDLRPLRSSRPFRDLWIGSSASQLGWQIATVAVLAQVWDLTGSPVATGAIGLATGLPMVVFGLLGGTLADTVDRRAVVWITTVGQLLAAAGLCAQALADNRNVLLLLALVAFGAASGALGAPARRTFPVRLPRSVPLRGVRSPYDCYRPIRWPRGSRSTMCPSRRQC